MLSGRLVNYKATDPLVCLKFLNLTFFFLNINTLFILLLVYFVVRYYEGCDDTPLEDLVPHFTNLVNLQADEKLQEEGELLYKVIRFEVRYIKKPTAAMEIRLNLHEIQDY